MIKFRYQLSKEWITKVSEMDEFANGATQVTVRLRDGHEVNEVLLSNSMYVVAARGFKDLPFSLDEIIDIFQTANDKKPRQHGGWEFWDDWKK